MKKIIITLSFGVFAFGFSSLLYGQQVSPEILNWYNGNKPGMETEKAYKILKKRTSSTVVVAVIDSGIDIEHEDLQGKIWKNKGETPNDGIDNDK
ncbi:MAG: peptidase S8, partial [Bacteroidota bacterium]